MHIFKYSKREGTKAAVMNEQISESTKAARSSELIRLDEELHRQYLEKFVGKRINVLFEEKIRINEEEYFVGHTMEYVKTALKADENLCSLENEIIEVTVQGLLNNEIVLAIL